LIFKERNRRAGELINVHHGKFDAKRYLHGNIKVHHWHLHGATIMKKDPEVEETGSGTLSKTCNLWQHHQSVTGTGPADDTAEYLGFHNGRIAMNAKRHPPVLERVNGEMLD
jgi:hypothetical protein